MNNAARPNKLETEAIAARLAAAGMKPSAINEASDDFAEGKLGADNLDEWIEKQRTARPYLYPTKGEADLESAAFGEFGKPNLTARSNLVKQIGEEAADARAKAWGLTGLHDYRTRAKRPGDAGNGDQKDKRPAKDNPWSAEGWNITKQGSVMRADPALGERLARAAGSFIGATRPTRAA